MSSTLTSSWECRKAAVAIDAQHEEGGLGKDQVQGSTEANTMECWRQRKEPVGYFKKRWPRGVKKFSLCSSKLPQPEKKSNSSKKSNSLKKRQPRGVKKSDGKSNAKKSNGLKKRQPQGA